MLMHESQDEEFSVRINRIVVVGDVTDAQIEEACKAMAEQHQVNKPRVTRIASANFPFRPRHLMESYASPEQLKQASLSDSEWRTFARRWITDLGKVSAFVVDEAAWRQWPSIDNNTSLYLALDKAYGVIPHWVAHTDGSVEYV